MSSGFTFHEIETQADAWMDARLVLVKQQARLATLFQRAAFDSLIFTGCGSTYYLALTATNLAQSRTGLNAKGAPASELLLHPESVYLGGSAPLLVTISRSASTTETVQAAQEFLARYGDAPGIIALTCYEYQPLTDLAGLAITATAGQEDSIAQTRSFSAMLILAEGLIEYLADGKSGPQQFSAVDHDYVRRAGAFAELLADPARYDRYFYLGSGPRYGLACEAMLKMKEMSLTNAEAFHPMEFRHGPKSMVDERTVVVGLLDAESGYSAEKAVLLEMRDLGATVIELSAHAGSDFQMPGDSLVRYLPPLQWLAYHRAVQKSLDPDRPRNLDKVVQLS